ncbi:MAG: hypothetical protein CUN56_12405 [Phototrophicales bacterium]|nr:MAG: hypothetical protein CUN56_12405 [Phototrophicales bacterium]
MTDQTTPKALEDSEETGGCRPPLWIILLAVVVVIFSAYLGLQIFSVLWGIIFIPDAPRPPDVVELSHDGGDYGYDLWHYESKLPPCELIAFYEQAGSTCTINAGACDGMTYIHPIYEEPNFAVCTGIREFSIFALRWEATLDVLYLENPSFSRFTLESEVLWGGVSSP